MKDTIVVDLDGTLADGRARYHLVSGKKRDYEAFHAKLGEDPVNEWCAEIVRRFHYKNDQGPFDEISVVLVSARPKSAQADTLAWLKKNYVPFGALFCLRADGDNTPDQELKRAWLHAYGKERVLFCVDDRKKVVDMWREEGLTCLQCADWGGDKPRVPRESAVNLVNRLDDCETGGDRIIMMLSALNGNSVLFTEDVNNMYPLK